MVVVEKLDNATAFSLKETDIPIPDTPDGAETDNGPDIRVDSAMIAVNEAMIEATVKVLGKTAALLTNIPEMDFDPDEVEQLKALWSPLVPAMNPAVAAVIGTTVIFAGKIAVYRSKKHAVRDVDVDRIERKKKERDEEPERIIESKVKKTGKVVKSEKARTKDTVQSGGEISGGNNKPVQE